MPRAKGAAKTGLSHQYFFSIPFAPSTENEPNPLSAQRPTTALFAAFLFLAPDSQSFSYHAAHVAGFIRLSRMTTVAKHLPQHSGKLLPPGFLTLRFSPKRRKSLVFRLYREVIIAHCREKSSTSGKRFLPFARQTILKKAGRLSNRRPLIPFTAGFPG